jgi:pSer/pThr/pTyr-binding forkhead associated (FHA) protein
MGSLDDRFRKACGVVGPLHLAWDGAAPGQTEERMFERPAVLVGSAAGADVLIDHPEVARRHAYFQVVDGRLFAVDLGSRTGLRWDGVPRRSGWIDPDQPVQVGPVTIRVMGRVELGVGPGPTSVRYASQRPLPGVVLEFQESEGLTRRYALDRVLVMLVGGAPGSQNRPSGTNVSHHVAALLRTPAGLWVIDLRSHWRVTVNGVPCRAVRLGDGDKIGLGNWSARVLYDDHAGTATLPVPVAPAIGPLPAALAEVPTGQLLSSSLVDALLDRAEPSATSNSSPFGQALMMLIRLLGDVHRDHLDLVRTELQRIDSLSRDIAAVRSSLENPVLPAPTPAEATTNGPVDRLLTVGNGLATDPPDPAIRPDPVVIREVINERIVAWEQERQSRWRQVLGLLVRS